MGVKHSKRKCRAGEVPRLFYDSYPLNRRIIIIDPVTGKISLDA